MVELRLSRSNEAAILLTPVRGDGVRGVGNVRDSRFRAARRFVRRAAGALVGASDEIIVEGVNPKRRASDYLDRLMPAPIHGQFGRFEDPICPKAIGLPDALKTEVVDRIRQVAIAAKVDVGAASCRPNMLVIVIADKTAMIDALRKKDPSYFYGIGTDRRKRLANSAAPYAAWQVVDLIGADGIPLQFDRDGVARLMTTVPASRLRNTVKPRVLGSVVIVRNSRAQQCDDAAARRFRAGPGDDSDRRSRPGRAGVIRAQYFNPGVTPVDGPQSVTWWDVAFLKSLANTRSNSYANIQRSEIRDQMVKEIRKVPADQR